MCGRFTLFINLKMISDELGLDISALKEVHPRYNIAPSQPILAVVQDGHRRLDYFRWGLIPSWAKDPKIGYKLINARMETVAEKPSFRSAFKNRRCLILADGFYEWKKGPKIKTPFYIRLKSKDVFVMAGIWSTWMDPNGSEIQTCTIITGPPNELLKPIHDRMPMILRKENHDVWLNQTSTSKELLALLKPYKASDMEAYPISTLVNSPKNDTVICIEKRT